MGYKLLRQEEGEHLNVIGDNQFIKLRGSDTGGTYALIEQVNLKGSGVPMHIHEREDEVFHILEGAVTFETEGRIFTETAGSTIFLPRRVAHSWRVEHEGTTRVLLICSPAGIENMFEEIAALKSQDMGRVMEICKRHGVSFV